MKETIVEEVVTIYSEDEIEKHARIDGGKNIPDAEQAEPSGFMQEIIHAYQQWANKEAEEWTAKLQSLEGQIEALFNGIESAFQADKEKIERTFDATRAHIEANHERVEAKKDLDEKERAYNALRVEVERPPVTHIPPWLYLALIVLLGFAEVPLNIKVFEMYGERVIETYVIAASMGLALPIAGHLVGMWIKQHYPKISWRKIFGALVVTSIVLFMLHGLTEMRVNYLESVKEQFGLSEETVQSAHQFFFINLVVFLAACGLSFLAHDSVLNYEQIYSAYRKSSKKFAALEDEKNTRIMEAETKKANDIREITDHSDKKRAEGSLLLGERDKVFKVAQVKEKGMLSGLKRSLGIYCQVNLQHRTDGLIPPCFNKTYAFEMHSDSYKEAQRSLDRIAQLLGGGNE